MSQLKLFSFEKLFDMETGYVMNFSDRTIKSFIYESVERDIFDKKYDYRSNSKANRVRKFVEVESDDVVYRLFKDLLEYFKDLNNLNIPENKKALYSRCLSELDKIYSTNSGISSKVKSIKITEDRTIKELRTSIEKEISESRYSNALDRLHTFSIKYFKEKCTKVGIQGTQGKALQSLIGEYVKAIEANHSEMTITILKVSISVFDKFNKVRNDKSLAHDNTLLDNKEARLIIEWVLSTLFFIDSL